MKWIELQRARWKGRHIQTHPGLATRYQLEVESVRGSQPPACCPAHPPARRRLPSTGIQAPGFWKSRVGAREVGAQKDRSSSPAPHHHTPAGSFPVNCAPEKLSWIPGRDACYLGQAGPPGACACSYLALGLRSGPHCLGTGRWQGLPLASPLWGLGHSTSLGERLWRGSAVAPCSVGE